MRAASVLIALAACSSPGAPRSIAPPTPRAGQIAAALRGLEPDATAPPSTIELAPPPDIVAMPHLPIDPDDLRWPLARDPELSPHAPIASWYRTTAPWQTLCQARGEPRGVDPAEALAYLTAWCGVAEDAVRARDRLADLVAARSQVIAAAARADLVDVIVETHLPPKTSLAWLAGRQLLDATMHDQLAATYAANGEPRAAGEVAEECDLYATSPSVRCHRLLRLHLAGRLPDGWRDQLDPAEPVCQRVAMYARCPLYADPDEPCRACTDDLKADVATCPGAPPEGTAGWRELMLQGLRARWPRARFNYVWIAYADLARYVAAYDNVDATILALAALENGLSLSRSCDDIYVHGIAQRARRIEETTPSEWRARAHAIWAALPRDCRR